MIAVDTNVFLRQMLDDNPKQRSAVRQFFNAAESRGEPVFISTVVLCEAVWVLRASYKLTREEIVEFLEGTLRATGLVLENRPVVARAVGSYKAGQADFADYVVGETSRANGARGLVTFDRALLQDPFARAPEHAFSGETLQ